MKKGIQTGTLLQKGTGITMLTPEEVKDIHNAGLEILEKTGLYVEGEEALEIFHGAGCIVDKAQKMVKIPSYIVEEALNSAPSQFIVRGRDEKKALVVGGKRTSFTVFGEGVRIIDPYTGENRSTGKMDLAAATRVADWIDEFDVIHRAVGSLDCPPETYAIHNFEAMIHNTTKTISLGAGSVRQAEKMIEISRMIRGDKNSLSLEPFMILASSPVSPLRLVKDLCEVAIVAARTRTPVRFTAMGLTGSTSPITLAGTTAVNNAEFYGCATLTQLVSKGTPVIRSASSCLMDMKSFDASVGSPETALLACMHIQMAQFNGIPSWSGGT